MRSSWCENGPCWSSGCRDLEEGVHCDLTYRSNRWGAGTALKQGRGRWVVGEERSWGAHWLVGPHVEQGWLGGQCVIWLRRVRLTFLCVPRVQILTQVPSVTRRPWQRWSSHTSRKPTSRRTSGESLYTCSPHLALRSRVLTCHSWERWTRAWVNSTSAAMAFPTPLSKRYVASSLLLAPFLSLLFVV